MTQQTQVRAHELAVGIAVQLTGERTRRDQQHDGDHGCDQRVDHEDAAPAGDRGDRPADGHGGRLTEKGDAHEARDSLLPLLHRHEVADEGQRHRHGRRREGARQRPIQSEIAKADTEGRKASDHREEEKADADHAELAEAVGQGPVQQLKQAERQHVCGDQDPRPCRLHAHGAGDRGQKRRDHPVVGHDDEAGEAEDDDQTLGVHGRPFVQQSVAMGTDLMVNYTPPGIYKATIVYES